MFRTTSLGDSSPSETIRPSERSRSIKWCLLYSKSSRPPI